MSPADDPKQHSLRIRRILERRILPSLLLDAGDDTAAAMGNRAAMVDSMLAIALQGREDEAMAEMRALHSTGWTVERLQLDLLTPTAVKLGELWESDTLSFVDVAVGTATLQRLMHLVWDTFVRHPVMPTGFRICIFPEPGAEHIFGAAMAARFFEHAGWRVDLVASGERQTLMALMRRGGVDALGLSLTRREMAEPAGSLIRDLTAACRDPVPIAVGGGPALIAEPYLRAVIGLDAVMTDASSAPAALADLIQSRRRM